MSRASTKHELQWAAKWLRRSLKKLYFVQNARPHLKNKWINLFLTPTFPSNVVPQRFECDPENQTTLITGEGESQGRIVEMFKLALLMSVSTLFAKYCSDCRVTSAQEKTELEKYSVFLDFTLFPRQFSSARKPFCAGSTICLQSSVERLLKKTKWRHDVTYLERSNFFFFVISQFVLLAINTSQLFFVHSGLLVKLVS